MNVLILSLNNKKYEKGLTKLKKEIQKPIFNIKVDGNVYEDNKISISVNDEIRIMEEGLQPFMFSSSKGTLVIQGQLPVPPGYYDNPSEANKFPGLPGTVISRDGGNTWNKWLPGKEQGIGPIIEGCVTELKDGTIIILDWIAEPSDDPDKVIGKLWTSIDDWKTIQGPFNVGYHIPGIKTDGFDDNGRPCTGVTFHRSVIELHDGTLLTTIYCWFKGDDFPATYEPSMKKFRTIIVKSVDGGKTWFFVSTVAAGNIGTEGFDEPVLIRLRQGTHEGRLICLMRTGRELYQAYSDDDGCTWSMAVPIEFEGIDIYDIKSWIKLFEDPDAVEMRGAFVDPDLIEMKNGILVCAFGVRIPEKGCWKHPEHERNGNYLAFSFDQGETWNNVIQLTSGIQTTQYMSVWEITPGTLYVTYDLGRWGQEGRCICGRSIKVERSESHDE